MDEPRDVPLLTNVLIGAISGFAATKVADLFALSGTVFFTVVGLLIIILTQFGTHLMSQFYEAD